DDRGCHSPWNLTRKEVGSVADNFGLKIGIEGEKEFKKALSEINQSFKVLGSEMKLVSSQFDANDKSIQALSARNTVLNKEIDAQRQKIETLRAAQIGRASCRDRVEGGGEQ